MSNVIATPMPEYTTSAEADSYMALSIILTLIVFIIVIGALVSSIRKGMKDDWKGSRIAGLIVAIFFAPLYWILYVCGVFKPK
jgi:heme/copper-type cytochrome/quinol oxidase subunit 4